MLGYHAFRLDRANRLKRRVASGQNAALYAGRIFALSWLAIAAAALWLSLATGHWQLSSAIAEESLVQLSSWEKTGIGLLII